MIAEIMKFVPDKTLFECYNVCQTWRDVIDRVIGLNLYIGKGKDEIWEDEDVRFHGLKAISRFGARQVNFSDLEYPIPVIPPYKYPLFVKKMYVDGYMTSDTFNKLSFPLTNLEQLSFHITALYALPVKQLRLNFQHLKQLEISVYSGQDIEYDNFPFMMNNVVDLMELPHVYNSLTRLSLYIPFYPDLASRATDAVLDFILRHKTSLRDLVVSLEETNGILIPAQDRSISVPTTPEYFAGIHLTSCILHCSLEDHASMTNLRKMLERQTKARSIYCTTGYIPLSNYNHVFLDCAETLTTVQLSISPEEGGISFHVFKLCTSLKVLALLGPEKEDVTEDIFEENEDNVEEEMLRRDIHGVRHLADTLEVVKIYNLFMDSTDANILVQKPHLRVIHFQNIGRYGDLGLRISDALELLGQRRIKCIKLHECINVKSVLLAQQGNDPKIFFCSLILRHHKDEDFEAHWDAKSKTYFPGVSRTEPQILPWDNPKHILQDHVFTLNRDSDDEAEDSDNDNNEEEADDEEEEDDEEFDDEEDDVEEEDADEGIEEDEEVDVEEDEVVGIEEIEEVEIEEIEEIENEEIDEDDDFDEDDENEEDEDEDDGEEDEGIEADLDEDAEEDNEDDLIDVEMDEEVDD